MSLSEQESLDNHSEQQGMSHSDLSDNNEPLEQNETSDKEELMVSGDNSAEDVALDPVSEEFNQSEESNHQSDAKSPKLQAHKKEFELFLASLESLPDAEAKLQHAINFMETSLSQGGTPHFKSFWEARNICLQLFKENIPPALRSILWDKYNDLSKEARRLKEILDEQSAFAVEQIEIAINALEGDIANFSENLEKISPVHFDVNSLALSSSLSNYERIQQELSFLNAQASRINAMRKELIRTEMRVRQKNRFFERLSQAGDKVFPRRKELIKDVSGLFLKDVEAFIQVHFKSENLDSSLFALREEIKTLQNMAKLLTLNTQSFTRTRMLLSECWDKIRTEDKERKKERTLQKEVFLKNFESSLKLLEEFDANYKEQQLQPTVATKQLDDLVNQIRNLELGRDEIRTLKEKVQAARKAIQSKQNEKDQEKVNQDLEKEKLRRGLVSDLKNNIEALFKDTTSLDAEAIENRRQTILNDLSQLTISKMERQEIEKLLKPLKDIISEKQESSILALSDDDRESLLQLKEVLKQRKARRQEIKTQMDSLRKTSGFSGLDFEQAMNMNDQLEVEKERFDKINQGIKEIEEKIQSLSKR